MHKIYPVRVLFLLALRFFLRFIANVVICWSVVVSDTFSYTLTDPAGVSVIDVTVDTPPTDSTGSGDSYAVTSISGTVEGQTIAGEDGAGGTVALSADGEFLYDNAIFASDAGGVGGSAYGVDNDGLLFDAGGVEYNLSSAAGSLYIASYNGNATQQQETILATNAPCFCPGTLILTDQGDVPVETLKAGDWAVIRGGGLRKIKWIGRRRFGGRAAAAHPSVWPVCFRAWSLGEGLPRRDLWVSPDHAMFLDGILVPARNLINAVSIVRAEGVCSVNYIHVELDEHDVILAEGAPTESFVDDGSRFWFDNAAEFEALHGREAETSARYCAPRLDSGYEVEAIRRRLAWIWAAEATKRPDWCGRSAADAQPRR
jgi:hypothetical protein